MLLCCLLLPLILELTLVEYKNPSMLTYCIQTWVAYILVVSWVVEEFKTTIFRGGFVRVRNALDRIPRQLTHNTSYLQNMGEYNNKCGGINRV